MNTDGKFPPGVRWVLSRAILVVAVVACSGCSNLPSASDGEKLIRNKINDQAGGRIKLVGFKKTNGQVMEAFGSRGYRMEWEGQIEFLSDCYWGPFDGGGSWSGDFYTVAGKPEHPDTMASFLQPQYVGKKEVSKGQKIRVSGTLVFEKTEKGWRGQDGRLY
jgi:hypothetical protein